MSEIEGGQSGHSYPYPIPIPRHGVEGIASISMDGLKETLWISATLVAPDIPPPIQCPIGLRQLV